jgi:hypothetical protein
VAWVLRRLELRELEIRGKTGNGNGLDAEFAEGAELRRGKATAKALTQRARRFRRGHGG